MEMLSRKRPLKRIYGNLEFFYEQNFAMNQTLRCMHQRQVSEIVGFITQII